MKKTKLEQYVIENDLVCDIQIDKENCYCTIYKDKDLYIKMSKAKTLNEAIEGAIDHHRRMTNDKISK